jgi:hypothetical protein
MSSHQLDCVTLKRSCFACIKSKRKCDRALPHCGRCARLGKGCSYKNEPVLSDVVPITNSRGADEPDMSIQSANPGPRTRPGIYGLRTPDANTLHTISLSLATLGIHHMRLDAPHVLMEWDKASFVYITAQLRSALESFLRTGRTLFIHHRLYSDGLPPLLRSVFAICNIQGSTGVAKQNTTDMSIAKTGAALLQASRTIHTFPSILEFVQALILLQIICLSRLGSNLLREQAERRLSLLSTWTQKLFNSAPSTLPSSLVSNFENQSFQNCTALEI